MLNYPIIALAPFRNRLNFGTFLNRLGLKKGGAEIGTHRGAFAFELLLRWEGNLVCIDPWQSVEGYEQQAAGLQQLWRTSGDREKDLEFCKKVLRRFKDRYILCRETSAGAIGAFSDETFDFVYIDGDHRQEMVAQDLSMWWPKVKPGGILAGHDVLCINEVNGGWGREIQAALFPFAAERGLTVFLVMEEDNSPWSFYLEKPK